MPPPRPPPISVGSAPHPRPPPSEPLPSVCLKGANSTAAGGTFARLSTSRSARHRRFRTSRVTTGRSPRHRWGRQVVGGGARSTVAQAPRGFVVGWVSRNLTLAPPLRWRCAPAPWSRLPTPPLKKIPGGRQFFWLQGGSSLAAVLDHARGLTPRASRGGGSAPPATLTRGRSGWSGRSTTSLVALESGGWP